MSKYNVNLWGSQPGTNDDCHTGLGFETRAEAEAAYADPTTVFGAYYANTAWFEIDGPDIHEERPNPAYVPDNDNDDDWIRERAMQAGMGGGCDAYNDAMGWEVE